MGWFSDRSVAPTEGPTGTQPAQTGGGGDAQAALAYIEKRKGELPPSPDSMSIIYNELKQQGFQVEQPTHAQGTKISADKLVLPGGAVYDFIGGVDGGDPRWTSPQDAGYWKDGKAYDDPNFQIRSSSSGAGQMGGGQFSLNGQNNLASFGAPGLLAPWTQQFQAPSGTDDPGFQFAMDQGLEALDRSKAARGTVLTGGAIKDAMGYATGMALQGYGDAWNRAKNVYDTNRGTFWGNQDNAYGKLAGAAGMGQGASTNLANIYTQGANANAQQTTTQNNNTNSTFGNLADFGMDAYKQWQQSRNRPQAGA